MKYNILIIMSLLFFCEVEAQNNTNDNNKPFHLEVNIPTQKGKKIYFGQYWKGSTYAIDSTLISEEGKVIFSSSEKMPDGQYFLYIKPDYQVDFLIGEEQSNIQLQVNENNIQENKASGSIDTDLLWRYLQVSYEIETWIKEIEDPNTPEDKRIFREKNLDALQQRFSSYKQTIFKQYKNTWGATYLKGLEPVTLPYKEPKTQEEYDANKEYGKYHFFDNINLNDPRFWRTNYMESYVDTYMQQWVDPVPDSLAAAASRLVAKTTGNEICFKEMLSKLTNEALKSNRMGDENIWARLFEEYILDKDVSWINKSQYTELSRMYERIKLNRIGMKAQNLRLETFNGDSIDTNGTKSDYTVLYFFDPNCTYCRTETPKIHDEFYPKYKDKGVEIITINIGNNKEEWEQFINNHKLTDWINCADFNFKSKYWMYYDTSGIPSVYVLNKNKEIIAKKLDLENLQKIFNYLIK